MKTSNPVFGINKTNSQNKTEIEQSRLILRSLGLKVAVRYLQIRGWSLDAVLWNLFKVEQKYEHLAGA